MEIKNSVELELKIRVNLELTEVEARALDALIGYGFEPFKEVFYEKLGKHYMQPHENGLKSLFEAVKTQVVPTLNKMDKIKKNLSGVLQETKSTIKLV